MADGHRRTDGRSLPATLTRLALLLVVLLPAGCARKASTGLAAPEDYCGPVEPTGGAAATVSRIAGLACGGIGSPAVLADHGRYKMWFTCGDSIAYSASVDGDHWTPAVGIRLLGYPTGSRPVAVSGPSVLKIRDLSFMWYTARDAADTLRIHLAVSVNDTAWFFVRRTPSPGDSLFSRARDPFVLYDGARFTMWFVSERARRGLWWATSTNGTFWTLPVETLAPLAPWESGGLGSPTVLFAGGQYHLWYQGWNADRSVSSIGYARSGDGFSWHECGENPLVKPGLETWNLGGVKDPEVALVGKRVRLYYVGRPALGSPTLVGYALPLANCLSWDCYGK
jgi:hypothetical protein